MDAPGVAPAIPARPASPFADSARLALLQSLTARLAALRDEQAVTDLVLGEALALLGGHNGSLCLLDTEGRHLELVAHRGYSADVTGAWARFPLDAGLPASDAVRQRRPVFLTSFAERDRLYPVFTGTPTMGDAAHAVMPLEAEGEPLGALVVGFPSPRTFDADDQRFLEALAGQCAVAIGRARLYAALEQARAAAEQASDRLAFLADASAALAAAGLELRPTLTRVAELAVPRVADWCAVYLVGDRGALRLEAVVHCDPDRLAAALELTRRYPPDTDTSSVVTAVRTGAAQVHWSLPHDVLVATARDAEHLALMEAVGLGSLFVLPLTARGRVHGALVLMNGPEHPAGPDDLALARELAARAAVAVDNARLYAERAEVARGLQASLLPPVLPEVDGLELGAVYVAANTGQDVGGDFYDVFAVADGEWLAVVGDVRGKGVAAAAVTGMARHVIRAAAVTEWSPAAILAQLNSVLVSQQVTRERDDETWEAAEPVFCTAVIVRLTRGPSGWRLVAASAGHPAPFLRRADGSVAPVALAGGAAGILADLGAADVELDLAPGEALVLLTDGILERHEGRRFVDVATITSALADGADAPTMAKSVETAARSVGAEGAGDDMVVLVMRALGSSPPGPGLTPSATPP
ncbi:MAG: SpoIIE family protein phosphatase [Acidimicrobiales bacterium]